MEAGDREWQRENPPAVEFDDAARGVLRASVTRMHATTAGAKLASFIEGCRRGKPSDGGVDSKYPDRVGSGIERP